MAGKVPHSGVYESDQEWQPTEEWERNWYLAHVLRPLDCLLLRVALRSPAIRKVARQGITNHIGIIHILQRGSSEFSHKKSVLSRYKPFWRRTRRTGAGPPQLPPSSLVTYLPEPHRRTFAAGAAADGGVEVDMGELDFGDENEARRLE